MTRFISQVQNLNIDSYNMLKQYVTPNTQEFEIFYNRPSSIPSETLEPESSNFVSLTTIHSAKGKEWYNVFIPGLTQGLFPRYQSDLNEETKLYYVACTRAKDNLFISSPRAYIVHSPKGCFAKYEQEPSIFTKTLST